MKTYIIIILGLLATLSIGACAKTPKAESVIEGAQASVESALRTYLIDNNIDPKQTSAQTAYIDLNGDQVKDALVLLRGRNWCASSGCPMLVFEGDRDQFQFVAKTIGVLVPVVVSEARTQDWRDLIVNIGGDGTQPKQVALQFDGKAYLLNPVVKPSLNAAAAIKGTEVFSPLITTPLPDNSKPAVAVRSAVLIGKDVGSEINVRSEPTT
ncbi:MAG: hypothetical protein F6K19_33155, partial [Cyanothece sp. SIO1E1]|nr:hypothetical protein [Cyanothece sp. SIO1E1]